MDTVEGRCISLDLIERQSRIHFDRECSRTRCGEGEVCVAGNCFQVSATAARQSTSCLNMDCDEGQACYRSVCYDVVDENGNPFDCAPGEATEDYAPPSCDEGRACYEGSCIPSARIPTSGIDFERVNIPLCGSGKVRVPGGCVSISQGNCGSCKQGEVCLGGNCYELTRQMGEPCQNQRCSGDARCVSGICVNL